MAFHTRASALALMLVLSSTAVGIAQDVTRAAEPNPTEIVRSMLQDPAIKNFVGIAENTWDFSTAGAVPGSEPVPTIESAR
jgi:hypothetical protein